MASDPESIAVWEAARLLGVDHHVDEQVIRRAAMNYMTKSQPGETSRSYLLAAGYLLRACKYDQAHFIGLARE